MDADVVSSNQAVAARRDAWRTMQPSARRRMVRQAVKEFVAWAKRRRGAAKKELTHEY